MKQKIIYVLGALILGIIALLYITSENENGNDANMKVKIITEAAKKEGSKTFSAEEITNIMDASRESGVNPVWIAGMTKAESGGKCLQRAFNNNYLKRATKMFGEDYQALVDAGLVKGKHHSGKKKDKAGKVRYTCRNCKTYSDHKGGEQSYFHRAYKIAPKSAVYVTAWGTNQVMGWELLRLGGLPVRGPGGNPDAIVEAFFNDPCKVSTKLLASWVKNTAGSAWKKRANRAASTGNISDWKWTTCKYLGCTKGKPGCQCNPDYTNRIMRNAKSFQQEHPKLVEEFGDVVPAAADPKKAQQQKPTPGKDLAGQTIILIGDSQMEWAGMGKQLEAMLTGRGGAVYRFARGASGVHFWALTLQGIRPKRLSNSKTRKWTSEYLKSLNPNQIIVSLGGNDAYAGNYGKNEKRMEAHFQRWTPPLIEQLKGAFDEGTTPDITWFGPGHRWTSGKAGRYGYGKNRKYLTKEQRQEQLRRGRDETNRILKEIAGEEGIKYVSMLNWVNDDERLEGLTPKEIRYDGIHYKGTMAGYYAEAIASKVGTPGERPTNPLKEPVEDPIKEPPKKDPLSEKFSVDLKDADIRELFGFIGKMTGVTIFVNKDISKNITIHLKNVTAEEAVKQLTKLANLKYRKPEWKTIYVGDPPYINYATQKKPIKGRPGRFVHDLKRVNFPEFDFDTFYEELDVYFSECEPNQDCITSPKLECCGRQIMLPKRGTDYKFGREHHAAWKKLQKAKTEKSAPPGAGSATHRTPLARDPDTSIADLFKKMAAEEEVVPLVPTEKTLKERQRMKTKTIINVHSRNCTLKESKTKAAAKAAEPVAKKLWKWFKITAGWLAYELFYGAVEEAAPKFYHKEAKYLDIDHYTNYFYRRWGISHIPPFSYFTGDEEPTPEGTLFGTDPKIMAEIEERALQVHGALQKLDGAREDNDEELIEKLGKEIFDRTNEIEAIIKNKKSSQLKCLAPPSGYGTAGVTERYGLGPGQMPAIADMGQEGDPEWEAAIATFNRLMYVFKHNVEAGKPITPDQCDLLHLYIYGPDELYSKEK
jgi:lysophospholipase L1-like esterase